MYHISTYIQDMKNYVLKSLLYILLVLTLTAFPSCKDEDPIGPDDPMTEIMENDTYDDHITVEDKMVPGVFVSTATWCYPCTLYAKPAVEQLLNSSHADDAIVVQVHSHEDSSLNNDQASTFAATVGSGGGILPIVTFSDGSTLDNMQNVSAFVTLMKDKIDAAKAVDPILAGGLRTKIEDSTLSVRTKVEFFQDISAQLYVSPFILENKVLADQEGAGIIEHDRVFRAVAMGDSSIEGERLTGTSHEIGDTQEHEFTFPIDAEWNSENLEVGAIIWGISADNFLVIVNMIK